MYQVLVIHVFLGGHHVHMWPCVCVCLSVCGRNNFKNKMASGGDGHLYTIHTNIDKYT